MRSVLRLSDAPSAIVIECPDCGRAGRTARTRAMAQHGDLSLPDFLEIVSADCPRRLHAVNGPACRARYARETVAALAAVDQHQGRSPGT